MEGQDNRVFLHFLNSQIVRKVENGKYGPFAVIVLPRSSRYAGYTFTVGLDRIHEDRYSDKRSYAAVDADREIKLTRPVKETDENGSVSYRNETVGIRADKLSGELDSWKTEKAEKAAEKIEKDLEEDDFLENFALGEEDPFEL